MNRRYFAFALVALATCLESFGLLSPAAAEEPAAIRRIGVLLVGTPPNSKQLLGLSEGLTKAGYVEGRNVQLEWRHAKGDYDRLPELAADLVKRKVDVIVVEHTLAVQALKRATSNIPIVMAIVADPLRGGLVDSLSHPSGNVTGLSLMTIDLAAKRLQLLKEAIPRATRIAVLWNPDTPSHVTAVQALKAAAPDLSVELKTIPVRTAGDFDAAFSGVTRARAEALYIMEGPPFTNVQETLTHVSNVRLPAIHATSWFSEGGGLMSYGANQTDMWRRSADYVVKILKGTKPSDLPIEQPNKFELVVNLITARALGLTISQSILVQADQVIR